MGKYESRRHRTGVLLVVGRRRVQLGLAAEGPVADIAAWRVVWNVPGKKSFPSLLIGTLVFFKLFVCLGGLVEGKLVRVKVASIAQEAKEEGGPVLINVGHVKFRSPG